jgi:hypothetical protein
MPSLTIITIISVVIWLVVFFVLPQFRKQFFWMGFLSTFLISGVLLMNTTWITTASADEYFFAWLGQLLMLTFFVGSIGAIAYEAIFHVHWKRPAHRHHHHVGILAIGPLLALIGFFIVPFAALHVLLIGLAIEVVLLLIVRSDLIVDGLFSGLFMGVLMSVLFYYFFGSVPGTFFETWQLTGIIVAGLPVELLLFFFFFGVLWGPWYEVMKDYHPRKAK